VDYWGSGGATPPPRRCARLPKFHARVTAYGTIDEANAAIGIAMLHIEDAPVRHVLTRIQKDLFDLGVDLCRPEREHRKVEPLRVSERQVAWLGETIDSFNAELSPLDSFVLPAETRPRSICTTPDPSIALPEDCSLQDGPKPRCR
jgi:ATP:cob(I)alamin adenosyltransferase